jgi:hypothetical protein
VELQRLTLKEFRDVVLKTGIFEELGITFSNPPRRKSWKSKNVSGSARGSLLARATG